MTQAPPVDYATMNLWHETMSIDEMADLLGVNPDMWYEDGRSMESGPDHIGNKWIISESKPTAIPDLVARIRPAVNGLRRLTEKGVRKHLCCQYSPSQGVGLPEIDTESSIFLAEHGFDVMISAIELRQRENAGGPD